MRWQELFADLEGMARAAQVLHRDSEVADRTRAETAQVTLMGRLHRCLGSEIRLEVRGAGGVAGRLERLGADWVLLATPADVVVATTAISAVANLAPGSTAPQAISVVASRTHLTAVLRAIARDRSLIAVRLVDGGAVVGTPDRVGADWVDMAVHDESLAPRRGSVSSRMTVALGAIATVRRGRNGWD